MRKSLWGLTALAVAGGILIWSTSIQARPNNPRVVFKNQAAEVNRDINGLYGSTYTGPTAESTGFEAAEGWNLGWMCDAATFSNCLGPPIPASCTGDPIADQNCCINNPNPYTGWYMSGSSQHCKEPHIDTANPATGEQHMRFTKDATGGNPAGCVGLGTACRQGAFTPALLGPLPIGPTSLSFKAALSKADPTGLPYGSELFFFTVADSHSSNYNAEILFDKYGIIMIYDFGIGDYYGAAYITGGGTYQKIGTVIDPCAGTIKYYLDDVEVYAQSAGMTGASEYIERSIFSESNDIYDWDVDDYVIFRDEPCPTECGNNVAESGEPVEECDGTDDAMCPGRCFPPGHAEQCTCARDGETCATATAVVNGANGPFLTHGGFFKYMADAPFTSVNTCDTDFDTEIYWGWDGDCMFDGVINDECIPDDFGGYQVPGDPAAPCYTTSGYPGESCMCVPTVPGTEYIFAVAQYGAGLPPPLGSNIHVEIMKKMTCGEPIPNGACCDGETGMCADNVPVEQCACEQCTWTEGKMCSMVECIRHTGACCDASPGTGGACTEGTYPEQCACEWCTWLKGEVCDGLTCDEVTGACCDALTGSCTVTLAAACGCEKCTWYKGDTCGEIQCTAVLGACCNHDDGSCTSTTMAACNCEKCEWTQGGDCQTVECLANFLPIPTVSEWGLAILALLLLTGAKVYFGRRRATA